MEFRERLFLGPTEAGELARALTKGRAEAAVLSTCNRIELYLATPDAAIAQARAFAELTRLSRFDETTRAHRLYRDGRRNRVAPLPRRCGLDSPVVSEA